MNPVLQLPVRQVAMHLAQHFDALEGGEAHRGVGVVEGHGHAVMSAFRQDRMSAFRHVSVAGMGGSFRMESVADFIRNTHENT